TKALILALTDDSTDNNNDNYSERLFIFPNNLIIVQWLLILFGAIMLVVNIRRDKERHQRDEERHQEEIDQKNCKIGRLKKQVAAKEKEINSLKCQKLTVTEVSDIISDPTCDYEGLKRIIRTCQCCNYRTERYVALPRLSFPSKPSYSSSAHKSNSGSSSRRRSNSSSSSNSYSSSSYDSSSYGSSGGSSSCGSSGDSFGGGSSGDSGAGGSF
ncbi:MAG: hypothetical protein AB4058_10385, partial [Microcystaceae cyanobacterium]